MIVEKINVAECNKQWKV